MATAPHCRLTAHGATLVACARLRKPWRSQIYLDGNNHHIAISPRRNKPGPRMMTRSSGTWARRFWRIGSQFVV